MLRKYLFLFVLLENYNTSRSGYLEGSSYIQPKVSVTVASAVTEWDKLIESGKTSIDCADPKDENVFFVLKGGVPPVVDPQDCKPKKFRDSVVEVPYSDDCLPTPETVQQYNPPGTNSFTVMEEGGETLTNGSYPWTVNSLFVNDPAGVVNENFAGGVKREYGPSQMVYNIRDLFALTYSLEYFPLFNSTAFTLMESRKEDGIYPILVGGGGINAGQKGDFMYGKETSGYEVPDAMGNRLMPYSVNGNPAVSEGTVALYSPFSDITHSGALAVGGRLSSIHCLFNKGDTNSPIQEIAPGVRIMLASYSSGSVTHGDNSEYFEFVDYPLVFGKSTIIGTAAYTMLSGGTATGVFIGDPLGPDASLSVADHTEFITGADSTDGTSDGAHAGGHFLTGGSSILSRVSAIPGTTASFLKDLMANNNYYIGRAYDLDHNDGRPFDADFRIRYVGGVFPGQEEYRVDGGFKADSTMCVTVAIGGVPYRMELNPYDEASGAGMRVSRDYYDSGKVVGADGQTYDVTLSQSFLDAMHDPTVCRILASNNNGTITPTFIRRYSETGWQYELWRYAQGGNLVAHFINLNNRPSGPLNIMLGEDMDGDGINTNSYGLGLTNGYNYAAGAMTSGLIGSMVYPIFVTDGTETKILAFLRLVTREVPDIVAYPKSSDTNTAAYSLSTVSAGLHHNITMCFVKWFTATYAQIWAPGGDYASTDYGGCNFLRYPNMLSAKPRLTRYTFDVVNGTITPLATITPTVAPVKWSNNTAAGTCSMTYSGQTASGTGKIYGVCKMPVEFDSYVYLYGSFTSFGGVPCKNVIKVYFTSSGPVAQSVSWDTAVTPYHHEEGESDSSSSDSPIRFELAPETVCGTGPSFSDRIVMYGGFTHVGSVAAPHSIVAIDPTSGEVSALTDPSRVGFSDKSNLMIAEPTSGICSYLNSNGGLGQVYSVTVYPEEIPWSRTVKKNSGILGVRNCYAKFYEKSAFESTAFLSYSTGPIFLVGHAKKFARKWTSTTNGQQILPGHVPVWRIMYSPMLVPFSLAAGDPYRHLDIDWSAVLLSGETIISDADEGGNESEVSSLESESSSGTVIGYQYPPGYGASYNNVAQKTRYAECTRGTIINVWVNFKDRLMTVPAEVLNDPKFYDGTASKLGDWELVGKIDPYSSDRYVSLDVYTTSYVGTVALTAWYPMDNIDVPAIGQGYVGSGSASLTSSLHDIPTVGYGFVPDISFRR